MSQSLAMEARRIVRDAASPVSPGETVKGQMRRAARALGFGDGHWRIKAAWHGEAGSWSAAAFEDLRARHRRWADRQRAAANSEAAKASLIFAALARRLERVDAEFHREDVAALVDLARRLGGESDGDLK